MYLMQLLNFYCCKVKWSFKHWWYHGTFFIFVSNLQKITNSLSFFFNNFVTLRQKLQFPLTSHCMWHRIQCGKFRGWTSLTSLQSLQLLAAEIHQCHIRLQRLVAIKSACWGRLPDSFKISYIFEKNWNYTNNITCRPLPWWAVIT